MISSVLDAAPIGVASWTTEGRLARANPVFVALVGEQKASEGTALAELLRPEEVASVDRRLGDIWAGRRNHLECDIRCQDPEGEPLWLRSFVTPVYGPTAEPAYLMSYVFDFSGQASGDHATDPLTDEAPVMLWLTDAAGRPRLGNRMCFEFVGADPKGGDLGRVWTASASTEDLAVAREEIDTAIAGQRPYEFLARFKRRDGEWRWLHHRARPVLSTEGSLEGYAGASVDVTESERVRAALHEAQQLFEHLSEAGPVAVVRTDPDGRITYLNGRWAELLPDAERQLFEFGWRTVLRNEDVDRILERGAASAETGEPFELRIRALEHLNLATRRPDDGKPRMVWGELRAAPIFDSGGEHRGFAATLVDVSAEVEADRLAKVLDASLDYVFLALPTGELTYANDAAVRDFGVAPTIEDSDGAFLWDVLDRGSVDFYYDMVEPVLHSEGVWQGELSLQVPRGGQTPVSAQLLAHLDEAGKVESVSLVARDISEVKEAQQQLRELATHDRLTGLANRALLYDRLEQALARNRRLGHGLAVMYCDLDEFKPVNDRFGHIAGDAVLVEIGDRIRQVIRGTDSAARVGGDEFVVIVEGTRDMGLLETVANRLIDTISRPIELESATVEVGVSIGLVMAGEDWDDVDRLMNLADRAMYRAKAEGRRRVRILDPVSEI